MSSWTPPMWDGGEDILKKNYVSLCYEDVSLKIRKEIENCSIWIDETIDI